jgi:DNA-directed RNA polymerase specialized sigma24 family protein
MNRIKGILKDGGDHDSNLRRFTQFCQKHERNIFAYILKIVRDRDAAEGLTQEALLVSYRDWSTFGDNPLQDCHRIADTLTNVYLKKKGFEPGK